MIYGDTVQIEDKTFDVVAEVGEYGYDWGVIALLRDSDGNLFFAQDSGCSCTSFGEDMILDELTQVKNWQEAVELAKEAAKDSYYVTDVHVVEFADRLRNG
jgi:hypothetical protein